MWRRARRGHPWDLAQAAILLGAAAAALAVLVALRWGAPAGLLVGIALEAAVATGAAVALRRYRERVRREVGAGLAALARMLEQAAADDGHPAESEGRDD